MKLIFSVFSALTLSIPIASAETLCSPTEATFFHCQVKETGKLLSLCGNIASKSLSSRYLQYRFGRPGKVELQYPRDKHDSLDSFQFARDYRKSAGTTTTSLSFDNAGYTYRVYATEYPVNDEPDNKMLKFGGVDVSSASKPAREISCSSVHIDKLELLERTVPH